MVTVKPVHLTCFLEETSRGLTCVSTKSFLICIAHRTPVTIHSPSRDPKDEDVKTLLEQIHSAYNFEPSRTVHRSGSSNEKGCYSELDRGLQHLSESRVYNDILGQVTVKDIFDIRIDCSIIVLIQEVFNRREGNDRSDHNRLGVRFMLYIDTRATCVSPSSFGCEMR